MGLLSWFQRRFRYLWRGGATEESDTEADGFLSYSGEWHALTSGFRKGVLGMRPVPELPDSKKEKRYFNWGHLTGRAGRDVASFGLGLAAYANLL